MKDKKPALHVVLIVTAVAAYWAAPLAYSVIPSSMRVFGVVFLPGMCIGFICEVFGNALIGSYMLPNDGVGMIVGATSAVIALGLSVTYGRRNRLSLLVSSCLISGMSVLTCVLFRFCNG